ncbi:MAG TPA: exopolysaccharide biosynthesis protein [Candidatus Saccharimonadales bacterium]|nr:exopolysaccharide biosynthesis protein [Candidatus Saccharimonadales bacterium]
MTTVRKFSQELQAWAKGEGPKTLNSLSTDFSKDTFAIIILLLMAVPALPAPTGGLTHVFEIITMLLSLELIAGRTTIWLPKRWRNKSLAGFARGKLMAKLIGVIRWFERFARLRGEKFMGSTYTVPFIGLCTFVFTLAAFVAPPFSGLDTLPSLGVVIIALSLIFSDVVLLLLGIAVGAVGIGLIFALGSVVFKLF